MRAQRREKCASSLPAHQERHQPFLRAPGLTWEQDGVCGTLHAQVIEHLGHLKGQSPEAHTELFSLCPVSLSSLCLICKIGLTLPATRVQHWRLEARRSGPCWDGAWRCGGLETLTAAKHGSGLLQRQDSCLPDLSLAFSAILPSA